MKKKTNKNLGGFGNEKMRSKIIMEVAKIIKKIIIERRREEEKKRRDDKIWG